MGAAFTATGRTNRSSGLSAAQGSLPTAGVSASHALLPEPAGVESGAGAVFTATGRAYRTSGLSAAQGSLSAAGVESSAVSRAQGPRPSFISIRTAIPAAMGLGTSFPRSRRSRRSSPRLLRSAISRLSSACCFSHFSSKCRSIADATFGAISLPPTAYPKSHTVRAVPTCGESRVPILAAAPHRLPSFFANGPYFLVFSSKPQAFFPAFHIARSALLAALPAKRSISRSIPAWPGDFLFPTEPSAPSALRSSVAAFIPSCHVRSRPNPCAGIAARETAARNRTAAQTAVRFQWMPGYRANMTLSPIAGLPSRTPRHRREGRPS